MRLTKPLALILLAGIPLLFASCFMMGIPWNTEGGLQAEFHKVVSLEPGGTIRLDSASGDVEIQGGDRHDVDVTARQEGVSSYTWSWFTGWNARPAPRVTVDAADNTVTIKTLGSDDPDQAPAVHYLILVPESVKLKDIRIGRGSLTVADVYGELATTIGEGDLTVENYSGSLDASVGAGSAEAEVLDLRDEDKITITVREGDIGLDLEKKAGAKLEASAEGGKIASDFDLKTAAPTHAVSVQLGSGQARVTLKALKGDIQIRKTD